MQNTLTYFNLSLFLFQSNQTGLSKGYGFVEFTNKEGYNNAVAQDNHVLEGSKVSPKNKTAILPIIIYPPGFLWL